MMEDVNTFEKWKKLAEESDFKCVYCGLDFLSSEYAYASAEVDHFIPQSEGGGSVVSACSFCNKLKRNRIFTSVEEAKKGIKGLREKYLKKYKFEELRSQHRKT